MRKTKKTVYLLVTCCVEESRFQVLNTVVSELQAEMTRKNMSILDDLWIFDNGSFPKAKEFLERNFSRDRIFYAQENYGFWSAINWFLAEMKVRGLNQYDYIHVIESDHTYFALEKLLAAEEALNRYPHIGSIRCQEFVVSEAHLYDKDLHLPGSRRYAWVRQIDWDGTQIRFHKTDNALDLYESRLVPLLHSVNRLDAMNYAFSELQNHEFLDEMQFQMYYRQKYPISGMIDGGLFHAKLTWGDSKKITGSWTPAQECAQIGYRNTRQDSIVQIGKMVVRHG